jgi:hypothetical protein
LGGLIGGITGGITISRLAGLVRGLPQRIATGIKDILSFGGGAVDTAANAVGLGGGDGGGDTNVGINLEGGLDAFVERATADGTLDFP